MGAPPASAISSLTPVTGGITGPGAQDVPLARIRLPSEPTTSCSSFATGSSGGGAPQVPVWQTKHSSAPPHGGPSGLGPKPQGGGGERGAGATGLGGPAGGARRR